MVERGDLENLKPPIDADARGCMSVPSACIGGSYLRGTRRAGYLLVTAWTQDVSLASYSNALRHSFRFQGCGLVPPLPSRARGNNVDSAAA